jgi:hypothetical protein
MPRKKGVSLSRRPKRLGTIYFRDRLHAPLQLHLNAFWPDVRDRSLSAHGARPFRADLHRDVWLLHRGAWQRGHCVLTPSYDGRQLSSTSRFLSGDCADYLWGDPEVQGPNVIPLQTFRHAAIGLRPPRAN